MVHTCNVPLYKKHCYYAAATSSTVQIHVEEEREIDEGASAEDMEQAAQEAERQAEEAQRRAAELRERAQRVRRSTTPLD